MLHINTLFKDKLRPSPPLLLQLDLTMCKTQFLDYLLAMNILLGNTHAHTHTHTHTTPHIASQHMHSTCTAHCTTTH